MTSVSDTTPAPLALSGRSLVVYLPDLSGGGTERLHLGLAPSFVRAGLRVTMLLNRAGGELLDLCPVPIATLDADSQIAGLPKLVAYLRRTRPDLLVANMEHMNVMALLAGKLAGGSTRVIVCQHNTLSEQAKRPGLKNRVLPSLYRALLPMAAGVVAVSKGVAHDLRSVTARTQLPVDVIYNGVVTEDFEARSSADAPYPWMEGPDETIVAIGRMVPQKDYPTLLRALAQLRKTRRVRLLILGDGPLRGDLEKLARSLGIGDDVVMPGFVPNPLPLLRRGRLLVLSSRFEGFGLVIAEALACGVPVVSTDCPHGPAEILDGGRFGALTPVGDPEALAQAIDRTLDQTIDPARLKQRGNEFTLVRCAGQYLELFQRVLTAGARAPS